MAGEKIFEMLVALYSPRLEMNIGYATVATDFFHFTKLLPSN